MKDGLKTEELNVGTVSGDTFTVGVAQIDATELAADSVGLSEVSDQVFQAGSHALSSGSRWVILGTAFSDASYHPVVTPMDQIDGGVDILGTGSIAPGSFIVVGSATAATTTFSWAAFGRNT